MRKHATRRMYLSQAATDIHYFLDAAGTLASNVTGYGVNVNLRKTTTINGTSGNTDTVVVGQGAQQKVYEGDFLIYQDEPRIVEKEVRHYILPGTGYTVIE